MRKTKEVLELVRDVLQTMPRPYSEDVIEDVFVAIEQNPLWHQRYTEQSAELRDWVVNNWIGKYTKRLTGMENIREVGATRTNLIKNYTKLRH
jgi:hypothetical protein